MDTEKLKEALDEYTKVRDAAWAEYRKVLGAAWAEYDKVEVPARAEYEKVGGAAWTQVAESADDPLVSWIVANCARYQEEAIQVLRALPATLRELDAIAEGNGWCGSWEDFRADAVRAGVIADGAE